MAAEKEIVHFMTQILFNSINIHIVSNVSIVFCISVFFKWKNIHVILAFKVKLNLTNVWLIILTLFAQLT